MISYYRFGARRQHLKRTHFLNEQVRTVYPAADCDRKQWCVVRYFYASAKEDRERRARLVELMDVVASVRDRGRA
jgi:hypothetical protein